MPRSSPWRATVLTLFPEMFPGPLGHSLAGPRAADQASGRWRRSTSATSPATGIAAWTTRRSAAGPAWCCGRTLSTPRSTRSRTIGRADLPDAARAAADPGDGAPLRRRAGRRAAVRPLRGHRPARHRGARPGGDQRRRLRAVRRRAGGDGAAGRLRAPAARRHGRGRERRRGKLRARPAGISALHPPGGLAGPARCRTCCCPATMRRSRPGGAPRPSGSRASAGPTCGASIPRDESAAMQH